MPTGDIVELALDDRHVVAHGNVQVPLAAAGLVGVVDADGTPVDLGRYARLREARKENCGGTWAEIYRAAGSPIKRR